MLAALWWTSLGLLVYVFALYPSLIFLLSRVRARSRPDPPDPLPFVTVLIPVYNEEEVVEEKLANTLALDYPADRLEILFASDGSTDRSVARLRARSDSRVTVIDYPGNRGKVAVLNETVPHTKGDILLLTDASGMLTPETLQAVVRHFPDPDVGCVCGIYHIFQEGRTRLDSAEHSYLRFEMLLRMWEGRFRTTLSGTGALCAIRKSDYQPLPEGAINEDYILPARIALSGKRVLYEPDAHIYDRISTSVAEVFRRRIRIAYGNWQQLGYLKALLHPSHPYLAWVYVSHKLLRMALPYLLIGLWMSSYGIDPRLFWVSSAGLVMLLVGGLAGLGLDRWFKAYNPLSVIALIFLNGAAVFVGTAKFLSGRPAEW